jgi:hypothetical protein
MFMRLITTFILFLTFISQALAQKEYLITTQLDTLVGKISIQQGGEFQVDRVRIKMGKEKKTLEAYEVREIHDKKTLYYPIKLNERYQFALVEREGSFLSLYRYVDLATNNSQYSGKLLVTKDGRQHIVSNIGFRKKLVEFLNQCESVQKKIEEGEYKRNDLYKIIDEYNACVDEKSQEEMKKIAASNDASKIDALIDMASELEIENKEELIEMLKDVKGKLKDGEKIPGYLQSAIKEKLAGEDALLDLFEDAIKQ